jgi:hypothetical protein
LLYLAPQAAGTFSTSSVNGTYAYANLNPPASASVNSGVLTSTGNGTVTSTSNDAGNSGVLTTGQTGTIALTVASNGRAVATDTSGNTSIVYILNPTTLVFFPTKTTDITPLISVAQQ